MSFDVRNPFDKDITLNGGYWYTTHSGLSSRLANERLTQVTIDMAQLRDKQVVDVGCGDGVYTYEIYRLCRPRKIVGVDVSREALKIARKRFGKSKKLHFFYGDVATLHKRKIHFDCAIVRGVIHHVDDPVKAISSIADVASEIVVLEPNGYNPILKIIEKLSPYHRQHGERSYPPFLLRHWLNQAGYDVVSKQYIGLVPFFCAAPLARFLKWMEPFIERLFFIRTIVCGVYVLHARKRDTR